MKTLWEKVSVHRLLKHVCQTRQKPGPYNLGQVTPSNQVHPEATNRHDPETSLGLLSSRTALCLRVSLPFFGDLLDEVTPSWSNPYSACIFVPSTSIYLMIVDAKKRGYLIMLQIEEMLAEMLAGASLKKPTLPTKPCRLTSSLVGKAFQSAGQAVLPCTPWRCCRHTRLTC